jgi:hypothetical protein
MFLQTLSRITPWIAIFHRLYSLSINRQTEFSL